MSEYTYFNSELGCASSYVLPLVSRTIATLPANSVVSDMGCGNGSVLGQLRGLGIKLHGLDVSSSGVAAAQKAFPEVAFEIADLTSDLSNHRLAGKCDVVISTEVVEHVFLPRIFARNCYLLLKPGGRLVLSTPYHGYAKNLSLALTGRMDAHFTALWDYGHIKFWSRRTLTALLHEAGFGACEFHGAGRIPYFWKSTVMIASKPETHEQAATTEE
jgi:2-polyprenyl-6-hydroxyphenyl methylase/3-demethylubiquinone-9 3-methyltransferase